MTYPNIAPTGNHTVIFQGWHRNDEGVIDGFYSFNAYGGENLDQHVISFNDSEHQELGDTYNPNGNYAINSMEDGTSVIYEETNNSCGMFASGHSFNGSAYYIVE